MRRRNRNELLLRMPNQIYNSYRLGSSSILTSWSGSSSTPHCALIAGKGPERQWERTGTFPMVLCEGTERPYTPKELEKEGPCSSPEPSGLEHRAVGLELLTSAILLFYSSVQAVANGAPALLGGVGWRLRISGKTRLCVGMRGCSSLLSAQAHRARADNSPHISPSPAGRLSLPCLSAEAAHLHQARTSALICVRHSTGRCFLQMAFV